jgi:hypothetical protein
LPSQLPTFLDTPFELGVFPTRDNGKLRTIQLTAIDERQLAHPLRPVLEVAPNL